VRGKKDFQIDRFGTAAERGSGLALDREDRSRGAVEEGLSQGFSTGVGHSELKEGRGGAG